MLMESFVGVMAMIAACTLDPGVYFAMNTTPAALAQASQALGQAGFLVTPETMQALAARMGEATLVARSGGAPSLAVGRAQIFATATGALGGGGRTLDALWYHFAIMFEALFILTTIDTGARVGRFMLQEIVGHVWLGFGEASWYPSVIASSACIVAGWAISCIRAWSIPWAGSIHCGRCSGSRTSCSPRWRCAWARRFWSRWAGSGLRGSRSPRSPGS